MEQWHTLLRRARTSRRLTQQALAAGAGITRETLSRYERGAVTPTRDQLLRLSDALALAPAERNTLLQTAGLEPVPAANLSDIVRRRRPPGSIAEEAESYTWPCMVLNDRYELAFWNQASARISTVDLPREAVTQRDRNVLRLAADPRYQAQLLNWREVIGYLMSLVKHDVADPHLAGAAEQWNYLGLILNDISERFPASLPALMEIWSQAAPHDDRTRNIYYPRWRVSSDGPELRFHSLIHGWSDFDAMYANDWMPANAATWDALNDIVPPPESPAAPAAPSPLPAAEPWNELLRQAREASNLTQRALAQAAGVDEQTVQRWETGRRGPSREGLLRFTRAMQLDGATTNTLLAAAGYDPEPSEWARFLAHEPLVRHDRPTTYQYPEPRGLEPVLTEISAHPWPCILVDRRCAIAGMNEAAARVFGFDTRRGLPAAGTLHLLQFVMDRTARDRFVNWEEVVTSLVPASLRRALGDQQRAASPALRPLVEELNRQDRDLLPNLQSLWQDAPPPVLTSRLVFPAVWRHATGDVLAFNTMVAPWGFDEPFWVLDWHPADADTWRFLGRP